MRKIILSILFLSLSLFASLSEDNIRLESECEKDNYQSCIDLAENNIYVYRMIDSMRENGLAFKDDNLTGEAKEKSDAAYELKANKEIISPLEKACGRGNSEACVLLSRIYYGGIGRISKNVNKVIEYSNLACLYGLGTGCYMLASINMEENPNLSLMDKMIFGKFERACELKIADACHICGKLAAMDHTNEAEKFKAIDFFKRGCLDKDLIHSETSKVDNCASYGLSLYLGHYIKKDEEAGIKLLVDSCKKGSGFACLKTGKIYELLSLTTAKKRNEFLKIAQKYYGDACNLQEKDGCENGNNISDILKKASVNKK